MSQASGSMGVMTSRDQLAKTIVDLAERKAREQMRELRSVVEKLSEAMQKAHGYSLTDRTPEPAGEAEWKEAQRLLKDLSR